MVIVGLGWLCVYFPRRRRRNILRQAGIGLREVARSGGSRDGDVGGDETGEENRPPAYARVGKPGELPPDYPHHDSR